MPHNTDLAYIPMFCSKNGKRMAAEFRQTSQGWVLEGAFRAGDGGSTAEGIVLHSPSIANSYTGCANCQSDNFIRCGCGALCCWSGKGDAWCPICKTGGRVGGSLTSLVGSGG